MPVVGDVDVGALPEVGGSVLVPPPVVVVVVVVGAGGGTDVGSVAGMGKQRSPPSSAGSSVRRCPAQIDGGRRAGQAEQDGESPSGRAGSRPGWRRWARPRRGRGARLPVGPHRRKPARGSSASVGPAHSPGWIVVGRGGRRREVLGAEDPDLGEDRRRRRGQRGRSAGRLPAARAGVRRDVGHRRRRRREGSGAEPAEGQIAGQGLEAGAHDPQVGPGSGCTTRMARITPASVQRASGRRRRRHR